jgi:hypothetical protein
MRSRYLALTITVVVAVCLAGQVAAVAADPPGAFGKTSPPNGATGVAVNPTTLSWGTAAGGGVEYRYCVDTIDNGACDAGWAGTGAATSVPHFGQSPDTTYYWQVQAYNGDGITDADSGTWFSFSTPAGPAGFGKVAPANGATGAALNPTLSWGSVAGVDHYARCIDTTDDNTCDGDSWSGTGTATTTQMNGLAPNTTYYWQVRAFVPPWPYAEADGGAWWSFTTGAAASQEMVFYSDQEYDGWVLEQDEDSGKGGTFDAGVATARVGDDDANRQWRSLLHFNTAALPDDAVITGVTVRIKKEGMVGTNPFNTHGYLVVDIKSGAYRDNPALEKFDFHAVGSRGNVGRFIKTPSAGWYRAPLRAASYPLVNLTGTTQFRLRFATDDDNDGTADYLNFYTGNYYAGAPQLIVTYYVP